MIFISVGTQLGFDRLIEIVDKWAECNPQIIFFAQIGNGLYRPSHMPYKQWLEPSEYDVMVSKSCLLISHAGMGSIITAIEASKPTIMLARLKSLNEHRNDHQLSTASKFKDRKGLYFPKNEAEFHDLLNNYNALLTPDEKNNVSVDLINYLEDFIDK